MFARTNLSKYSAIVLIVAMISAITYTTASGFTLHKKESKASIEKYVDSSVVVSEVEEEEDKSFFDILPGDISLQNFQPNPPVSFTLQTAFHFPVYFTPPYLRVTFTHAP
jgi:hypothetical protein